MLYAPSRDRQWYMYSATDPKSNIRRKFLRALVRQPKSREDSENVGILPEVLGGITLVEQSVMKALQGALDELELAAYDTNGKADHIHMYLCILRAQELGNLTGALRRFLTLTTSYPQTLGTKYNYLPFFNVSKYILM